AISNDVNLSIGGTAGFLPYRISANYTNREGILKTSSMQRAIFGFTLTPKFFDDHLSVSANAKGYYINNKIVSQSIVSGALTSDPTRTVMSEYDMASGSTGTLYNGYNAWINAGTINTQAQTNVVAYLDERDTQADVLKSNGNLQLDYSLHALPELRFNLNLGYDITDAEYHVDIADNSQSAWRSYNQDGAATRYIATQEKTNTLLDFYMNYKKEFDFIQSNLDATAGYSWQKFTASGGNNGTEFLTAGYNEVSMTDGQYNLTVNEANNDRIGTTYTADPSSEDWATQLQLLSFFGRVNYSVMNRYLLTATLRADATSRFSPDNRWGYFPSLALGWKITEESFMESARDVMNEFKLRASYGVTGQQDLGDDYFPYMAIYSSSVQGSYYVDREGTGTYISTLYPEGYNTSLKWEETKTWNVGFDFGFLSNRITASLDYYFRNTDDLLSYVPVAAGSTTTNYLNLNVGSMESQGVEFAIVTKPVVTKDFTWTLGYNVAWNENEITKLNNQDDEDAYIATGDIGGMTAITVQAHKVGYPAYSFYLYEQVYDADGYPMEGVYVDQNDDGYINDNDKVISKSKDPKVTMALNSNMSYKNWDFGFSLRANFGAYVYNGVLTNRTNLSNLYMGGSLTNLLESDFYFDGSVATTSLYMSDYFLSKADFLRCDNITLGYTWENLLSDKLRLRVYGAVQNPFIITGYSGLDPEIYSGIDNEVYPSAVTYTLGVIATF
ncbi:MAG: SusC/RagA family TonB-linked outer membrane protein, partial [Bacteroidales bacterium]